MSYTETDVNKVREDPEKLIQIARSILTSYEIARLALSLAWGQPVENVTDADIQAVRFPRSEAWPPRGERLSF